MSIMPMIKEIYKTPIKMTTEFFFLAVIISVTVGGILSSIMIKHTLNSQPKIIIKDHEDISREIEEVYQHGVRAKLNGVEAKANPYTSTIDRINWFSIVIFSVTVLSIPLIWP